MRKKQKAGVICLIAGTSLLLLGLLAAFTMGTMFVPVSIFLSILLNSAGITLLRGGEGDKRK